MKKAMAVVAVALLSSLALAQEIKRPTADAYTATSSCIGTAQSNATAMPNAYDDDATHAATSSSLTQASPGSAGNSKTARVFTTWQSASGAYSALTINIRAACSNTGSGTNGLCAAWYSLDGGSNWTSLFTSGNMASYPATTTSLSIAAGTMLSQVQVRVCIGASYDGVNTASTSTTMTAYDIWTEGTLAAITRKFQVTGSE